MKRTAWLVAGIAALFAAGAAAQAEDIQDRVIAAIEKAAPSVVQIEFECRRTDNRGTDKFSATGVVVGGDGLVMVTNVNEIDPPVGGRHQKPESFTITFEKDVSAKAKFLGKDEELNLALLKIRELTDEEKKERAKNEDAKDPELKPLPLSPCKELALAQPLIVVDRLGAGADFRPTFALLRVTAVVPKPEQPTTYHIDGPMSAHPGCPVLDLDGKVVGFIGRNSVTPSGGGRSISIGGRTFFVGGGRRTGAPRILCTDDFKEFLADPSKFLRRKSWVGVKGMQPLNKDLAEQLGIDAEGGIILGEILKKSPASKAGLLTGDVVVAVDGEALEIEEAKDLEAFSKRVQRAEAGQVFKLTVHRQEKDGWKKLELQLTAEEEPVQEYEVQEWESKTFGLRVKPLTRDFLDRERLDLETTGVRITYVENAGYADLAGLQNNDIIQGVVLKRVGDLDAFKKRLYEVAEAREPEVCFNVIRRGQSLFLCVRPDWELQKKDEEEGEKK